MRLQLALNVSDLNQAVNYYSRLFATSPHKIRAGYANFAIDDPALKLVLIENGDADERINHLGVETSTQEELDAAISRLSAEGLAQKLEENTTCCHATQNKVWMSEPDGLAWEWYRITDDNPPESGLACC
ncbi:MAG: ArsI/CadI family heavy metal resistance metalloenzyme [Gammaproteobacteria bacterium]|nr:ArsI/CadI family heavy metal resistance metalloenzyme [Gammaproteobacteria bacterium]